MNLEIILYEQPRVPAAVNLGDRRILVESHRQTEQKIGHRVASAARVVAVETEGAVVVERCVLDQFFERGLAAEFEVVAAARPTEDIARLIEIAATYWSADADIEVETSGNLNLRQRLRSLHIELRAEISERFLGQVESPAEQPHVGDAELIDHRRSDRPRVAEVDVVLLPGERALDPGQVSPHRLDVGACLEKVTTRQLMRAAQRVIHLDLNLIAIEWPCLLRFICAVWQVGQW